MGTYNNGNIEDRIRDLERILSLQGKCCTYGNIDFHKCEHVKSHWGEALAKVESELVEKQELRAALFTTSGARLIDVLERITDDLLAVYTVQKCLVFRINDLITQARAAIDKARKES